MDYSDTNPNHAEVRHREENRGNPTQYAPENTIKKRQNQQYRGESQKHPSRVQQRRESRRKYRHRASQTKFEDKGVLQDATIVQIRENTPSETDSASDNVEDTRSTSSRQRRDDRAARAAMHRRHKRRLQRKVKTAIQKQSNKSLA